MWGICRKAVMMVMMVKVVMVVKMVKILPNNALAISSPMHCNDS